MPVQAHLVGVISGNDGNSNLNRGIATAVHRACPWQMDSKQIDYFLLTDFANTSRTCPLMPCDLDAKLPFC